MFSTNVWVNKLFVLAIALCGVWVLDRIGSAFRRIEDHLNDIAGQCQSGVRRLDELDYNMREILSEVKRTDKSSGVLDDIRIELQGGSGAVGPLKAIQNEIEGSARGSLSDIKNDIEAIREAVESSAGSRLT